LTSRRRKWPFRLVLFYDFCHLNYYYI
jgi:hypothetical protein